MRAGEEREKEKSTGLERLCSRDETTIKNLRRDQAHGACLSAEGKRAVSHISGLL